MKNINSTGAKVSLSLPEGEKWSSERDMKEEKNVLKYLSLQTQ